MPKKSRNPKIVSRNIRTQRCTPQGRLISLSLQIIYHYKAETICFLTQVICYRGIVHCDINSPFVSKACRQLSFFFFFLGSTCDQPTSPHGSVIIHPTQREKYQNGQVILFGCKQGFYLDGMPIITCNGKKWTQTQFRCLGMTQLNSL